MVSYLGPVDLVHVSDAGGDNVGELFGLESLRVFDDFLDDVVLPTVRLDNDQQRRHGLRAHRL